MRKDIGLYRGKRKDNGEWVYGYLGVFKGISQIFVPFTEEQEKTNEGHIFSAIGGLWHIVLPESVGQFTGLYDARGKRIYEGDVIEFGSTDYYCSKEVGEVVFKDGCYGIEYIPDYARKLALKTSKSFHRIGEVDKWQDMGASGTIYYKYYKVGDMQNG